MDEFKFVVGAPELIKKYNELSYKIIVVTNQSGIARNIFSEIDMHKLHSHINSLLSKIHAHVDAFYFCPHHPDFTGECSCRKPKPGMLLQAAMDLDIDLSGSILIGDKDSDIEAGVAAGVGTLIKNVTNREVKL
ncbi:MAG: HAD family hydrolase [Candidatus Taylorbacteria bacterium]